MPRRPSPQPGPGSTSYLDRVRWVEVSNENAEDAPGGALLMVTGGGTDDGDSADDYGVPTVDQPDADGLTGLLVAHPAGIPAGGRGLASPSDFVPVAYDDAETPAVGETWGSAAGSWELTKGKAGWKVAAPAVASQDLKLVECWRAGAADTPEPYPLTDWCLLGSPTNVLGMQRLMFNPVTGVATCETRGFCGCPPADDPPEPGCCDLWYCTADGPVEVEADEDGVYTPPEGWDGTEPHLTEAAALEACPVPPLVVECGEGEIEVPQVMFVTLTDLTGDFVGLFPSNSVACPMSVITGGAFGEGSVTDGNGNTWRAEVAVNCAAAGCGGAGFYQVVVLFGPDTCNGIGTVYTGTAASGWTADGGGTSEIQYLACRAVGDPVAAGGGEEVYSAVVDCVTQGVAGTFTVNLS